MAQMITFRLNARPTYSERMTDARGELRKIIKDQLCTRSSAIVLRRAHFSPRCLLTLNILGAITGDRDAAMSWTRKSYMKNIVTRYRVRIEGWPLADVPFKNLSDVSNLPKLQLLLRGWKEGTIRFRKITDAEYTEMVTDPTPWIGPPGGDGEGDGNAD